MRDALREVIEGVTRHRVRAAATAFGVFWGIFMLALLLGGGNGMRNGFLGLYQNSAANMVWAEADVTTQNFEGLSIGRRLKIDLSDLDAVQKSVPELFDLSPRQPLPQGLKVSYGARSMRLPTFGVYPSFANVELTVAVRGRLLNELDQQRARKVAIVGVNARDLLFGQADPVGLKIQIGGMDFKVVGEFDDAGSDDERRRIYIPYSTLRSFDGSTEVQTMVAQLRPGADPEQVRASVMRVMGRRHRFSPTDTGALYVFFMDEEFKRLTRLLRGIDVSVLVVGLGTLISGMIGVSNILFVSIRERAREFGVRRALGATARSILLMVIGEALILALCAGGLGLLSALGVLELVQTLELKTEFFNQPQVDAMTVLGALGILVCTALVAGYFPAREAARMTPIEALRRE